MANVDKPMGLVPVKTLNGAPWNGQANIYHVDSTEANALAIGDPVYFAGTADANGIASVTLATAGTGNPILGVIVGWGTKEGLMADPSNLDSTIIPAAKTKDYYVMVVDDPNTIFEVQEVSGGTALAATEVGLNANLIAGTDNGYVSGWEVNNSGEVVTATLQVRLLGLARRSDNAFGEHAKWLVLINNHAYRIGQVGL